MINSKKIRYSLVVILLVIICFIIIILNPNYQNNKKNEVKLVESGKDVKLDVAVEPTEKKQDGTRKSPKQLSMQANVPVSRTNSESEILLKMDKKTLLKIMGATDALKWQEEYDKGIYSPEYDQTWQDDMFSRAYELLLDQRFSNDLSVDKFNCENGVCDLTFRKFSQSSTPGPKLASDYILSLKNHPAILESGKTRNVYLKSMQMIDGEYVVNASIR